MTWLSVQRSGLTCMRATTRSLSASVKVTPFNSAKGIFIDRIFSSGVMVAGHLLSSLDEHGWRGVIRQ
jgi:hypothetical protein